MNEVKIGNHINIYTFTSGVYIKSLKVNGEEISTAKDKRDFDVTVTENCTVEVVAYQRVDVSTVNSIDDVKHITCGNVYVIDADGKQVTSLECEVGQTVTLKAVAEVGYRFVALNKIYPNPVEEIKDFTYTVTETDAEYGMVTFQGVFEVDNENPSYTVRTKSIYEMVNGVPNEQIGYVYIYLGEGEPTVFDDLWVTEYTAHAGDKLHLLCMCREDYHLVSYCLSAGYPNSTFPGDYYTVSADDADADGVIWITGVAEKNSGIDDVITSSAAPAYDRASSTLTVGTPAIVYNASGVAVLSVEAGSSSLSSLPAGVYIAVTSDGKTLKFVR